jgi:hypothetical protein
MWGYRIPNYNVGQTPNGLGMIKTVVYGSVTMLLFDVAQLVPALRQIHGKDSVTLQELVKSIEALGSNEMKELKEKGTIIQYTTLNAGDSIYVPSGWILAESVLSGAMVYGLRRTILFRGAGSASYDELLGLTASKKHPKQEAVAKFLKNADDDDEDS